MKQGNSQNMVAALSLTIVLAACSGQDATVTTTPTDGNSTTAAASAAQTSSSAPKTSPVIIPAPTPPCKNKAIVAGAGVASLSVYDMPAAINGTNFFVLWDSCKWNGMWADLTWTDGGTAYNSDGTYEYGTDAGIDTIKFNPYGLTYKIYKDIWPLARGEYILALTNPEVINIDWNSTARINRTIKTGLAFTDYHVNSSLRDPFCSASRDNLNTCLRLGFDPNLRPNDFRVTLTPRS